MKSSLTFGFSLAALLTFPQVVPAAVLGDPAPPLQIAEWIKGRPVDLAAGKSNKIFVVEFWATWCPPCRASIPHLTELQKKFKDQNVVFVGVSDEDVGTVRRFVANMGDKMDYTVAVDRDRKTGAAYMGAFGINGIPHAFIVDKQGRIVWNGHPMAGLEKTLEDLLAGKFDLGTAKKRDAARVKLEAFYELASTSNDEAQIDKAGKELEALDQELGGIEPGEKFDAAQVRKEIKFRGALHEYQMAFGAGNDAPALEKLEKQAAALAPKDFDFAAFKESLALRKTFADYYTAAAGRGDTDKLPELAKKLGDVKTKNAVMLNQWAWAILTDENIKTRDVQLAAKLARAALDASDGKEPSVLDTYARALFDSGKVADAVAYQQKAVAAADDEQMKKELEATLKHYQETVAAK